MENGINKKYCEICNTTYVDPGNKLCHKCAYDANECPMCKSPLKYNKCDTSANRTEFELLSEEADKLYEESKTDPLSWFVGRTDIQNYCNRGYIHYAYGPGNIRVIFIGHSQLDSLNKAMSFCKNVKNAKYVELEFTAMKL